ncbi:MAG: DUF389 domain-containing protein [Microthrixaceae bacterium]
MVGQAEDGTHDAAGRDHDPDGPAPIRYEPHRSGGDANQSAGLHDAPGGVFPRQTGPARRDLLVATAQFVAVAAVVVVLVALSEKDRELFERLLGLVLVVGLGVTTTSVLRGPDRNWGLGLAGAVGALAGVGLMISPNRWLEGITLLAGGGLAVAGMLTAVRSRLSVTHRRDELAQSGLLLVAGGALVVLPETMLRLVLVVLAGLVIAHIVVATGARLGLTTLEEDHGQGALLRWLAVRGASAKRRQSVYDHTFFEGGEATARTGRYVLMMFLASVISAVGVLTDSTAVVVGAMLIAPLIGPMMGMGLSLAMGWPTRLSRSALHVASGVGIALGTAWVSAAILAVNVDVVANTQVASRASPTITDLLVAVAAGAAGAFALSRSDVSSALPGVAVAIALVPPLSVVGVAAQAGEWAEARGALLLFLTNMIAIVFVGGTTFVVTGIAPLRRVAESQHRVRTWGGALAILGVIVVGGLILNGEQVARDSLAVGQARAEVTDWLGADSEFAIVSVEVDQRDVTVNLVGPGDPPPAAQLAQRLAAGLDRPVRLDLQWVPRNRAIVSSD